MSECEFEKHLDSYYDGELSDERAREVETHLRTCASCAAACGGMRRLSMALMEYKRPTVTPEVMERFRDAVQTGSERLLIGWVLRVTGVAAAIMLAGSLWLATTPASANAPMAWEAVAANPRVETAAPSRETQLAEELVAELGSNETEQGQ